MTKIILGNKLWLENSFWKKKKKRGDWKSNSREKQPRIKKKYRYKKKDKVV